MPPWLCERPLHARVSFYRAAREPRSDRVSRQRLGAHAHCGELRNLMSGVLLHDGFHAFVVVALRACPRQEAGYASDCVGGANLEQRQCCDHDRGDDCQDDAVLSHRLSFLDRKPGAELMDQLREPHDDSPPFGISSARGAREGSMRGEVEKWTRLTATLRDTLSNVLSVLGAPLRLTGQSRPVHRLGSA